MNAPVPSPLRRTVDPVFAVFAAVAVVHVALNLADVSPWDSVTKCLLAPLLVVWVLRRGAPGIIAVALVACALGDLFLEIDGMFIAGMGAFAVAHVCFISFFVRCGALERIKRQPLVVGILGITAMLLVAWVWDGLDPMLRAPVLVYAVLLSTTAALALVTNLVAGVGGVCFLISDAIIALGLADRIDDSGLGSKLGIMPLYIVAIALLARSGIALGARFRRSGSTRAA